MELKEQLMADLKVAMRAKDTDTRNTIRNLQAAIKQQEVDGRAVLDNAAVQKVVQKQAKQRRESIAEYTKAGRDDLIEVEQTELAVIEKYLPQMMSREEITQIASKTIADMGVTDPKSMGKVMGRVMGQVKGKADGGLVNQVVRELMADLA